MGGACTLQRVGVQKERLEVAERGSDVHRGLARCIKPPTPEVIRAIMPENSPCFLHGLWRSLTFLPRLRATVCARPHRLEHVLHHRHQHRVHVGGGGGAAAAAIVVGSSSGLLVPPPLGLVLCPLRPQALHWHHELFVARRVDVRLHLLQSTLRIRW